MVNDEVYKDQEYESGVLDNEVNSMCSIEVYPLKYNLDGLQGLRAKVEVAKCEVENYGNNVLWQLKEDLLSFNNL